MRDLTLTLTQITTRKKPLSTTAVLHLNLAILAVILGLGLMYLFQINSLGTKGYQIRNLEQQLQALEAEQKHLEVQSSALMSITRIQQTAQANNFVPSTGVTYIKDGDYALNN